jgi:hypothetical protein
MTPMSVSKPEYSIEDGWYVASASISVHEKTFELKYKVSEGPLAKGSDPFLAAALFPAMKTGQPLHISSTVSPKLLSATQRMQDTYHKWFPDFQKIPVQAEPRLLDNEKPSADVGLFFSGGVDSFYTLLKNQDEITRLILINGFMYENASQRPKVTNEIRRVAEELGKSLIVVEVNIREFSDQYTYWEDQYAGIAMASVGLLLSPQFRKLYYASSFSYEHWKPTAIHPLLEPLFSTETLTFEIDGCEASRPEKIGRISSSDIALNSLRACSQKYSYNCGECEKCLRTMIALQAVGVLERCKSFPQKIDLEAVSNIKLDELRDIYAKENLGLLENSGNAPELAEALRFSIKNYEYKKIETLLNVNFTEFLVSEYGNKFLKGKKNMLFQSLCQENSGWLLREVFKERVKELDQKLLFGMLQRMYGMAKANGRSSRDKSE